MELDPETPLERGALRLMLHRDDDPTDPRTDADHLGTMICVHRQYTLGDQDNAGWWEILGRLGPTAFPRYLRAFQGATVVLPLYLLDHSGITMRTRGFGDVDPQGWDWGLVGFIFDTPKGREVTGCEGEDQIRQALEAEVAEYASYLEGDVWGYVITEAKTCDLGYQHREEVESCWGFIGQEYAGQAAMEAWATWTEDSEEMGDGQGDAAVPAGD